MRDIIIFTSHGEIKTKIPTKYIDDDLILYWIDVICNENTEGWYKYKLI